MRDKDAELREEIRAHLAMATADRVERGEAPEEAAAHARRDLGNVSQIQEAVRDVRGRRWIEQAAQDIRYALRIFRRNPGFALVAILSLTLGIGANTALFEVVNAVRLRALPVHDPARLMEVRLTDMDGARGNFDTSRPAVTQPIWRELEARQDALDGLFAWSGATFNLAQGGETRLSEGLWVSANFFTTLGVRAQAGRLLSSEDDRAGCAPRAVLGDGFWRRVYGGDRAVVGRTIALDGRSAEIIGVSAPGFHGLEVGRAFDVALPLCAEPMFSDDGNGRANDGTTWWLSVFGRLKPGSSPESAAARLRTIAPSLFEATLPPGYPPESAPKYLKFQFGVYPGGSGVSQLRQAYSTPLWLLLGIAGLVLVITCANLANLLLARATAREREIAVRLGLGASRGRIIRQLLTESLLLVVIGTAAAMLLAGTLGQWLVAALETADNPITLSLSADWTVSAFAVGLALATCLLFGLAPAIRATRVPADSVMRGTTRGATAARPSVAIRRTLVVVQIALSVALLFGSLLFARTFYNVLTVDPGFNPDGVVIASVNLSALQLPADQLLAARERVVERIRAVPGVTAATRAAVVPLSGNSGGGTVWPESDRGRRFDTYINFVGPRFFDTLEIPMIAGRDFDRRDTPASTLVAIVNDTFAARFGGSAAIGRRFTRNSTPSSPETTVEIVGIVRNSVYLTLKEDPDPVAYYPDTQREAYPYASVIVRSSLPAASTTSAITGALANADPRLEVRYRVMKTMIADTLVQERLLAGLSGGFGGLAALLTVVGLYGLIAYTVTRRTAEIGIRLALGATRPAIARLFLRETGTLLTVGTLCGVVLALAGGRTASALLFGVKPYDPVTLSVAVVLLAAVAMAASCAPARRATRIEPVAALRAD